MFPIRVPIPAIFAPAFFSLNMIIPLQVIPVKTAPSAYSNKIILGLTCARTLRILLTVVFPASETRTCDTSRSDLFNSSLFHHVHGTRSLSISSNSSHLPMVTPPSSTSLTEPVNSLSASRHMIKLTLPKSQSYSFITYSPSMVFRFMSPATADRNSLHSSSDLSERCSTSSCTSHQDIIRKPMANPKEPTRLSNSTCDIIAPISKITGLNYSRSPNSPTTTLPMPQLVFHHFSPTRAITQSLTLILSAMSLQPALASSLLTLTSSITIWQNPSSSLKSATR